jgi:hypothetical protein
MEEQYKYISINKESEQIYSTNIWTWYMSREYDRLPKIKLEKTACW